MADSWDDAALISAFNAALGKYQEKHQKKRQSKDQKHNAAAASNNDVESYEKEVPESSNATDQVVEDPASEQPAAEEGGYSWPGGDQQNSFPYPYPYPYPPYAQPPWGGFVYPPPVYPVFPSFQGSHCCHMCPCNSASVHTSTSSSIPSFETLKAAAEKSLSQMPDDKKPSLEGDSNLADVLLAWFNAGFRTAGYLQQMQAKH